MRKTIIIVSAFVLGLTANNFAMSNVPASYKVAVVDVQRVVSSSKQIAALKKEQQTQMNELNALLDKARKEVAFASDEKNAKSLEAKYTKELNDKKATMDKNYATKLKQIDAAITKEVENKAKSNGYNLVLSKGTVLFGGVDITGEIIKTIK